MGLDGVELIMEVEDHFGINIQLDEATKIVTVGDLVEIIRQRIAAAHEKSCATLKAFYAVRSTVRQAVGNERFRMRPNEAFSTRLTPRQCRKLWRLLPEKGLVPRDLWLPVPLRNIVRFFAWGLLALLLFLSMAVNGMYLIAAIVITPLWLVSLFYLSAPWRCVPPEGWTTLGDLMNKFVGFTIATKQTHLRTKEEILQELRPVIEMSLGVSPSLITLQASFIHDLGID